jgi:monoamine oxidase
VEAFLNQNANALIYNERSGVAPQQYRIAKAGLYGYLSELLAKVVNQGSLDQFLSPEDEDRLLTFLRGFGSIGSKEEGYAY